MYLEIDEGFPGHRKTLRLCSLMSDPKAGWHMVWLWTWACRSCKDGDLRGMGAFEVEEAARYQAHDGKLCAAMIDAGFLDKDETGNPTGIHNWMKRTGAAILKMEAEAERKKLYRAHKEGKCGLSCEWCKKGQGPSTDNPRTVGRTSSGQTDTDQSRQDKTSPDKTRESRMRTLPNEHCKPTPLSVVAQYLSIRAEVVVGYVVGASGLFQQPQTGDIAKAAEWLASMSPEDCADIEPAIRLACQHVKDAAPGWNKPDMAKVGFLFGCIVRSWPDLREELHGCAPKLKQPQASPGPKAVVWKES
jgi:hypothetical protein